MKILGILSLTILILFSACDNNDPEPDYSSMLKITTNSIYGEIITDGNGRALYFFSDDANGKASCYDDCVSKWPVFSASKLEISEGLDGNDFELITRNDGTTQVTYKGWPLYYLSPNSDGVLEEPGLVSCDGLNDVWFVAKPDYSIMIANAQLVGDDGLNYKEDYTEGTGITIYFTDSRGNTIYRFVKDYFDDNNFTDSDFGNDAAWPIFYEEIMSVPSTLNKDDFGMIDVFGKKQLTYKGNPLYYYGGDGNRGDNKGVSVPAPGVWPIVNTSTVDAPAMP